MRRHRSTTDETFDVGIDSRTSMNDSACQVSLPFNGKIDKLSFTLVPIPLTKEELVAIDDFRFENRMRNRSDAVRALLKLALDQIGEDPAKPP